MNIEEAKKLIDKQSIGKGGVGDIPVVKTHIVKVLLDQLDKPKLEVPQMIADVIESFDEDVNYLHEHMSYQSDEVREWLTHNEREFYEAWLAYPNITVEKENLYTVEIPNPNERQLSFVLMRQLSGNVSIKVMHRDNLDLLKIDNNLQLTESEIRKDFDWAWQFREEVVE
ncbi:TPA: DUF1642 domain-containing protein [Streptococcus agalactiae]|uniref:DUF1642 domain-containing protein n=1 Tax=Streptococcus agalactiae TaxID=1311 RepID=UPI000810DF42|nr:DUF1642 domain-containing protein [Streptococcus agalactiae]OCM48720.1 hypothetical protein AX232_09260 [Streptococcus agalactiae]HEN9186222.1 DUF1642 domain-containing protein [Streptococcus agalactiae]HEN9196335.1 DUF1642 domain-containing protein [Streptococcus agalactiae]HEO0090357.1 DUF1642 domain-containing protein [Streptococcus agalactiae]HEO0249309.1 DUF1642 domain-containing protein [Streptococcus agalactiae]